jgi:hypothetical protein
MRPRVMMRARAVLVGDAHFKEWRTRIFRLVYPICLLIVLDGFLIASQLRNFRFHEKDVPPLAFFRCQPLHCFELGPEL